MANNHYVITPPTGVFVTLDDAKLHCRITSDDTSQDDVVSRLIAAAADYVSMAIQRPLLVTSFGIKLNGFFNSRHNAHNHHQRLASVYGFGSAGYPIQIPMPPLISVDSVQYIAQNGTLTTLDPSLYVVDTTSIVGQIYPAYGHLWPIPQPIQNCVTISFTAGYETVPPALQSAMLMLISHWFQNRESVLVAGAGVSVQIAQTLDCLLAPYQTGSMGVS